MSERTTPIILDLGKKKKRAIRELERGHGRLVDEVEKSIEEVLAGLGDEVHGKVLVPIVLVYRRRRRARSEG